MKGDWQKEGEINCGNTKEGLTDKGWEKAEQGQNRKR